MVGATMNGVLFAIDGVDSSLVNSFRASANG